jgi:hypothetical protein
VQKDIPRIGVSKSLADYNLRLHSCSKEESFFPSKEISSVESIMKQQPEEEFVSGLT